MKRLLIVALALFLGITAFSQPKRHMVVEELTGTWCTYCPRGNWYADSMTHEYEDLIFIALHVNDPMELVGYPDSSGLTGAPTANIDRVKKKLSTGIWFEGLTVRMTEIPEANVYVSTTYNATTRKLTATVSAEFFEDLAGDYRFAAVVVEDGVTGDNTQYNQTNYYAGNSSYWGGYEKMPASIPYYMIAYDHVGRALLGGYYGKQNSLPASISTNDTFSYTFTYTLPAEFNENYIRVAGLLVNAATSEIINANKSPYMNGNTNAKPFFINTPEVDAYVSTEYDETIYAHDPDDKNITITTVGTVPPWLTVGIKGKVVTLLGTPTAVGTVNLELKIDDGTESINKVFTINVNAAYPHNWQLVGGTQVGGKQVFAPDVAVNKNNTIFTSYTDLATQQVLVHQLQNGNWKQVGGAVDYMGNWTSMSVDKAGIPYVLYNIYDGTDVKNLMVKKFNGTNWEQVGQIITPSPTAGIDIGFDNNNIPHIVCQEGENNAMMMFYNKSTGYWDLVGYSLAYRGASLNMAFDSKNRPLAMYVDIDNNNIPYVKRFENDVWEVVGGNSVDTSGVYAYYGFAVDKNDNIYVALTRNYQKQLMVYKYDGTSWSMIGEDIAGGESFNTRIVVDNWGKVYVLSRDGIKKDRPTVWSWDGSVWESTGPRGFSKSSISFGEITIDNNNMPIVSYRDAGNNYNQTVMSYGTFTDIEEDFIFTDNSIDAYPNPAKNRIQLDLSNATSGDYIVSDIFGHTVAKGSFQSESVSINISHLLSGVYIVTVHADNQQWYSKFTKE
ncbi:MAG: Omp28-related outer membrane protein [Bacteroidetes bacterium]|mgnify:FL=1|nr:Omp28-related outer membrane protein [Bacteroidota bacterium]